MSSSSVFYSIILFYHLSSSSSAFVVPDEAQLIPINMAAEYKAIEKFKYLTCLADEDCQKIYNNSICISETGVCQKIWTDLPLDNLNKETGSVHRTSYYYSLGGFFLFCFLISLCCRCCCMCVWRMRVERHLQEANRVLHQAQNNQQQPNESPNDKPPEYDKPPSYEEVMNLAQVVSKADPEAVGDGQGAVGGEVQRTVHVETVNETSQNRTEQISNRAEQMSTTNPQPSITLEKVVTNHVHRARSAPSLTLWNQTDDV